MPNWEELFHDYWVIKLWETLAWLDGTSQTDQSEATALPGTGVWGGAERSKLFSVAWKKKHISTTAIHEVCCYTLQNKICIQHNGLLSLKYTVEICVHLKLKTENLNKTNFELKLM